jgi:hypothetical protein
MSATLRTSKAVKTCLSMARNEGLTFLSISDGGKHFRMEFADNRGRVLRMIATKSSGSNARHINNARAQLRRFARGHDHGLIVTSEV